IVLISAIVALAEMYGRLDQEVKDYIPNLITGKKTVAVVHRLSTADILRKIFAVTVIIGLGMILVLGSASLFFILISALYLGRYVLMEHLFFPHPSSSIRNVLRQTVPRRLRRYIGYCFEYFSTLLAILLTIFLFVFLVLKL
ncbi:MAG TPA: hypothetical protein VED00_02400, partial [archaeon]|nr:hypothetical protein [archaeon]